MSRIKADPESRRRFQFWTRLVFALAVGTLFGWLAWEGPQKPTTDDEGDSDRSHDSYDGVIAEKNLQDTPDSQEAIGLDGLYEQVGVRQVWANKKEDPFAELSPARVALDKRLSAADRWSGEQPTDDAVRQVVVHSRSPPEE